MEIKRIRDKLFKKRFAVPAILAAAALFALAFSGRENVDGGKREREISLLSDELCDRIEELCESVGGVREAKVMLTLDTSEEYVYAKNTERNGDYVKIDTVDGSSGGIELYVISPRVRGVAVVCTGGDRASVKKTIADLVSSALGIEISKVSVAGT